MPWWIPVALLWVLGRKAKPVAPESKPQPQPKSGGKVTQWKNGTFGSPPPGMQMHESFGKNWPVAYAKAFQIWSAVDGAGTNTKLLFGVLSTLTNGEVKWVGKRTQWWTWDGKKWVNSGNSLLWHIEDEWLFESTQKEIKKTLPTFKLS